MLPEPDCCNREKSEKEHQEQFSIFSGTVLQGRGLCAVFSQREGKWKSSLANTMKYERFHFFIIMLLIYVLLLLVCPRTDPFLMLLVWEIWDIIGLVCI